MIQESYPDSAERNSSIAALYLSSCGLQALVYESI